MSIEGAKQKQKQKLKVQDFTSANMSGGGFAGWQNQLNSYLTKGQGRSQVIQILQDPDQESFHAFQFSMLDIDDESDLITTAILIKPQETLMEVKLVSLIQNIALITIYSSHKCSVTNYL